MGIMDFFKKKEEPIDNFSGLDHGLGNNPNPLDNLGNFDQGLGQNFENNGLGQDNHSKFEPSNNLSTMSNLNSSNFSQIQNVQQNQPQSMPMSNDIAKDLQILSLKLDAIKSELDSVNQRIQNIERIAQKDEQQMQQQQKRWY